MIFDGVDERGCFVCGFYWVVNNLFRIVLSGGKRIKRLMRGDLGQDDFMDIAM